MDVLGVLVGGVDWLGCGCGCVDCVVGKWFVVLLVVIYLIVEVVMINGMGLVLVL